MPATQFYAPPQQDHLEVRCYPVLRLISLFYKLAACFIILAAITAFIGLVVGVVVTPAYLLLPALLACILSGGLGALSLYVVARLIDLFLETNNHTRHIAEALKEQNRLLKQIYRRQANPYPRPADAIAERQVRLIPMPPEL